jgi:hypothetical protein
MVIFSLILNYLLHSIKRGSLYINLCALIGAKSAAADGPDHQTQPPLHARVPGLFYFCQSQLTALHFGCWLCNEFGQKIATLHSKVNGRADFTIPTEARLAVEVAKFKQPLDVRHFFACYRTRGEISALRSLGSLG